MEKLGEIMKSCENCKYSTEHYTGCSECVGWGKYINWKPVEIFKPLPMEELKVEDYEVITQADGLVKLMTKVDEVSLDNPEHPANQELLPELDAFNLEEQAKSRENLLKFCDKATLTNNNLAIFKQIQNKSHLCHYTKFQLDFDINTSIRFIHAFDDRPELVGKFIYKHHEEKLFSVIEPQLAEHFIKTQCSNEAEEFINRYVGQGKKKQYRRIKVTENSLTKYFES